MVKNLIGSRTLANVIDSNTIRKMSGPNKRVYKYFITAIFLNIISGYHDTKIQEEHFSQVMIIKKVSKQIFSEDDVKSFEVILFKNLKEKSFLEPYNSDFFNKVIAFFRKRLEDLNKRNLSFFRAKELSEIVNISVYFGYSQVSDHHWIEFDLLKGLIITIPEGIILNDLKVQWNAIIDIRNELKENRAKVTSELEFQKLETNRSLLYSYGALYRNLIFLSVTLVESYLYNLLYSFKEKSYGTQHVEIQTLYHTNPRKIQDTQIIEDVLYVLFPNIKDKTQKKYVQYKKVLLIRDRYVHASAFPDEADRNRSCLEPLLDVDETTLINALNNAISFIKKIDEYMPENLRLLFWWYDEILDFSKFEKFSLTNKAARINKISTF